MTERAHSSGSARAEQELRESTAWVAESSDAALHELRVHEAELRMQNEALRNLHVEVSVLHERYRDLFRHAQNLVSDLPRVSTDPLAPAPRRGGRALGRR